MADRSKVARKRSVVDLEGFGVSATELLLAVKSGSRSRMRNGQYMRYVIRDR